MFQPLTPRTTPWPLLVLFACLCLFGACAPVLDSALPPARAIRANQPPDAPADVLDRLTVVDVRYYGFDHRLHEGQVDWMHFQKVPAELRPWMRRWRR